jgi:NADP-dependent 3-hydroxy acid dehydrogenase YdfG
VSYYATRVAVITGAGSGIGRALAGELASHGAQLALSDRDLDAVTETARRCRAAGARVRVDCLDVTDPEAVQDYSSAVFGEFDRVNLVFCVAGVIISGSLVASTFGDIEYLMKANVLGVMNVAKAFLPHVIASGGGHVVTFSSAFGLMAAPNYSAYSASKFAVR